MDWPRAHLTWRVSGWCVPVHDADEVDEQRSVVAVGGFGGRLPAQEEDGGLTNLFFLGDLVACRGRLVRSVAWSHGYQGLAVRVVRGWWCERHSTQEHGTQGD